MKKIFYFASMMLAVFTTYSCTSVEDNPANGNIPVTIEDANGNKYETSPIATFTGEVGSEVTLGLGVYDNYDIYGVDFGDGKIVVDTVGNQNGGVKGEDGKTLPGTTHTGYTKFTGTVAGNGTIIVYGKSDIWYLNLSGGALPTSFDQEKLQNVVQVSITGANVESLELPALEKMTQFNFNNSPLKSIDVSKATALTSLTINNTTASKYEPQLESIDVSMLTALDYLSLQGNNKASGKLTKIDLSNNTKLTKVYLNYNQITEITLGDNLITDFNASDNNLESFDMSKLTSIKNIYLSGNKLKALDLSGITNKGNIQIQNNLFTLATLPTKPAITTASKYTYAPQPAYEVADAITDANTVLDLSSQLTATGIQTEPATTTFTFLAGTTELKENEDYKVVEPGKFTFLKSQAEKVHAVMTTAAFPKFTGKNAYVTTEFTVNVGGGSSETNNAIFSWEAGTVTGGQVAGNGADASNVKEDIITISSKKANIATDNITITLNEALQAGDVISVTGYRNKNAEGKVVSLYLWFNDNTNMFNDNETWVNIYKDESNPDYDKDGETPNTNTYIVPEGAAGTKVIKLARSKAGTNLYVTKFTIEHK